MVWNRGGGTLVASRHSSEQPPARADWMPRVARRCCATSYALRLRRSEWSNSKDALSMIAGKSLWFNLIYDGRKTYRDNWGEGFATKILGPDDETVRARREDARKTLDLLISTLAGLPTEAQPDAATRLGACDRLLSIEPADLSFYSTNLEMAAKDDKDAKVRECVAKLLIEIRK